MSSCESALVDALTRPIQGPVSEPVLTWVVTGAWPRPAIPEFSQLLDVLGEEIHALLRRDKPVLAALNSAQNRVEQIMVENGRFR